MGFFRGVDAKDSLFQQLQIVDEAVLHGLGDESRRSCLWHLRERRLRILPEEMDGVMASRRRYA